MTIGYGIARSINWGVKKNIDGSILLADAAVAGGGGSSFVPSDLANMTLWLKSDTGTSSQVDGTAISQWDDQSGNGFNAVQATAAKQPTYRASVVNGHPTIRFDGTDDLMTTTFSSTLAQPNTVFFVAKINVSGDKAFMDGLSDTTRAMVREFSGAWHYYAGGAATVSGGTPDTAWHIFGMTWDGASSSLDVDGVTVASGDSGTQGLGGLTIGALYAGSIPFNGDFAEIAVYSDSKTSEEKTNWYNYASSRYNITI